MFSLNLQFAFGIVIYFFIIRVLSVGKYPNNELSRCGLGIPSFWGVSAGKTAVNGLKSSVPFGNIRLTFLRNQGACVSAVRATPMPSQGNALLNGRGDFLGRPSAHLTRTGKRVR